MENYTPKFKINDEVYFENNKYFVRGMIAKSSSHPDPEIEYFLSKKLNRTCTTNETDLSSVNERQLNSLKEQRNNKIEEAKKLLKKEGLTVT